MSFTQIKSGALLSYFAIFFNMAAGLVYTPWMVGKIGVSDFGLFALVGAFLSYFLLDFGLDQAISRYIARYRAQGNEGAVGPLLGITTRLYLLIDLAIVVVLVVVFFFLGNIFKELTPAETAKLEVVYIIAGFFSVVSFPLMPVNGAMIAYERFVVLKLAEVAQKVLVIALMVAALLSGQGLFALVFINGLLMFATRLFLFAYLKHKEKIRINLTHYNKALAKELLGFSSWIFVIGLAQRLTLNIVPIILGVFSGTRAIAIFAIAMLLEAYTWTFANALNGLFLPKVSRMVSANENRQEVLVLMIRVGRLQLLVTGLMITGLIIFGSSFISLWMGDDFAMSYYVALLLIVPGIITLTQTIASTLVVVENQVKFRALLLLFSGALSLSLGVVLAPSYGALGAAVGVCTALVLVHVIGMNIFYHKTMKLSMVRFFKETHLRLLPPMLATALAGFALLHFIAVDTWLSLGMAILAFSVLYSVVMWFLAMNAEEKNLVMGLLWFRKQ